MSITTLFISRKRSWMGFMKYAVFLRGVNVGGIKVPMTELRILLATLLVRDVKTYLQAGNVVLESDMSAIELKPMMEKALGERFGYEAFVLVFAHEELAGILARIPFAEDAAKHRYVILCNTQAVTEELAAQRSELDLGVEDIAVGERVLYWNVPVGSSTDTAFAKILAKPKYKAVTTNRNAKTLQKMA